MPDYLPMGVFMTEIDSEFLSNLYHALRANRRRLAVQKLKAADENVLSVRKLAREIAGHEMGITTRQATGEPYRNVYNALAQTHLPTLAEVGIIIYDPERQTVSPGPNFTIALLLIIVNESTVDALYGFGSVEL
jgi:hypothetical protein